MFHTRPRSIGSGVNPGPIAVFTALVLGTLIPTASAPSTFTSRGPYELAGEMARCDFVVIGKVGKSFREGRSTVPIDVERILLGSVPDRRLVVRARLKRVIIPWNGTRGARVVAWGGWSRATDTCAVGAVMRVRENGSMWDGEAGYALIDGRPVSEPGSLERLRSGLEENWFRNGPEFLAGGRGVVLAVVKAVSLESGEPILDVEPVRAIVGDARGMPRWIRFQCGMAPMSESLLLLPNPVAPQDTLDAPVCPGQLTIRDPQSVPSLFGVAVENLHFLFGRVADGYELTREHYAPLVHPPSQRSGR